MRKLRQATQQSMTKHERLKLRQVRYEATLATMLIARNELVEAKAEFHEEYAAMVDANRTCWCSRPASHMYTAPCPDRPA